MKIYDSEIQDHSSQIVVGEYEILLASTIDGEQGVQYINNALINPDFKLSYKLNWNKDRTSLYSVDFKMPNDEGKLSNFFETLPYGLLKKNRTGIGATTLELKSRRNSIVVVPTRALAFEKAKQSKNPNTNKYKVLYVGGRIIGFQVPTIEEYIADIDIKYKKFIVVVDSLPTLLNIIKEEHFKDYFIMFDEIDSYQYDSSYRPNMESAFANYFKFPKTQRCLVSATIGTFSNPLINKEPIINVTFNSPSPRNITVQHTDNVLVTTKKLIEERLESSPNEKILVAFNLVTRGILPIIKSLPEDIQTKCGVLCSSKIKDDIGAFYREIVSSELPTQITFMSCTYFVGIDIQERFHLISCCDVFHPFTLLTIDKFQQIAGRCRNNEGLLSETIVYNSIGEIQNHNLDLNKIRKVICDDAQLLVDISQNIYNAKHRFQTLFFGSQDINNSDLESCSRKKYGQSSTLNTVFEHEGKLNIAYFNIDNIIIQNSLLQSLYSEQSILPSQLREQGNIVEVAPSISDPEQIREEIIDDIQESILQTREEERDTFIEQLRAKDSIEERRQLAEGLRINCSRGNTLFLEHFIELQNYVPFEQLISGLQEWDSPRTYNDFFNSVIIWALHRDHPIRLLINRLFEIGKSYTGDEMKQKINEIWLALGYGTLSNRQSLPKRNLFCSSRITSRRDTNGIPERVYRIIDLNPLQFTGESINPITQTNTPQLRRLLKF